MIGASSRRLVLAAVNDRFRRALPFGGGVPGRVVMTRGVAASADLAAILLAVRSFDAFTAGNDPHGEHDFGAVLVGGVRHFWKIDYYADDALTFGADDPATRCYRVLTIMLAEEY